MFFLIPSEAEIQREDGTVVVANLLVDAFEDPHQSPSFLDRLGLCEQSSTHLADINFDGFNDFIIRYPSGILGNEVEFVWLYDSLHKSFKFSKVFDEKLDANAVQLNAKKKLMMSTIEDTASDNLYVTILRWKKGRIETVRECQKVEPHDQQATDNTTSACYAIFNSN